MDRKKTKTSIIKIPAPEQVSTLDKFTIDFEPISSLSLMERASHIFCDWLTSKFPHKTETIIFLCGPGNNGGDGLASARIMAEKNYKTAVLFVGDLKKTSPDCGANIKKFKELYPENFNVLKNPGQLREINKNHIVVDSILGNGLTRPLEGRLKKIAETVNDLPNTVVAIDIPTGLFASKHSDGVSMNADWTLSLEFPKLAYFMPENKDRVGNWDYRSIGLLKEGIDKIECPHYYPTETYIDSLLTPREKFSHKGDYGKIQLVAGQLGFSGAAALTALGCMRSGAGLSWLHTPKSCISPVQAIIPESICIPDPETSHISDIPILPGIDTIACGPGIGKNPVTASALKKMLENVHSNQNLILDADALNIIAENNWLTSIPPNTIITPHPGEFERLFGIGENDFETLEIQRSASVEYKLNILFKGAYSRVSTPKGEVFFNPTGNPGMATAGSGDVLTGVIAGISGRGLKPTHAAIAGMYLHGLAGDLAAEKLGQDGLIARDIANHLPFALKVFEKI